MPDGIAIESALLRKLSSPSYSPMGIPCYRSSSPVEIFGKLAGLVRSCDFAGITRSRPLSSNEISHGKTDVPDTEASQRYRASAYDPACQFKHRFTRAKMLFMIIASRIPIASARSHRGSQVRVRTPRDPSSEPRRGAS